MKRLIILLSVFLVGVVGCAPTIRNPPMLREQAELIRNNWENLKLGMSIEEVNNLLGPFSVYRAKICDCDECAPTDRITGWKIPNPLGAVEQKIERQWYLYPSVKEPSVYICLTFRHGKLVDGWAETISGTVYIR